MNMCMLLTKSWDVHFCTLRFGWHSLMASSRMSLMGLKNNLEVDYGFLRPHYELISRHMDPSRINVVGVHIIFADKHLSSVSILLS